MKIENHILLPAKQVPSPNFNERPCGCEPELIVVHNISLPPGEFGGHHIETFFQNTLARHEHPYFEEIAAMEVSSHLLIKRDGSVVQFVPFNMRAWHAGQSNYEGRENCNDFSIGIELEGTDTLPFTEAQYKALGELTDFITQHYPRITLGRIVGHNDIAPGRKTDPGVAFDWARYRMRVTGLKYSD